jgi:hypothetical protein
MLQRIGALRPTPWFLNLMVKLIAGDNVIGALKSAKPAAIISLKLEASLKDGCFY